MLATRPTPGRARENLRNGLTAEQSYWTSNQVFDAVPADMKGLEPSLNWTNTAPANSSGNTVLVTAGSNTQAGDTIFLQAYAADGNCYTIEATNDPAYSSANVGAPTTGYAANTGACVAPAAASKYVTVAGTGKAATQANVQAKGAFPTTFYNTF